VIRPALSEARSYRMTEISYLARFADSANFSRAFRQWTGVSPSQWLVGAG
jgi:AraC-like DNA-binding protein